MADPNLGYGDQNAVDIDKYNQYMRAQPWYQALIKSFGQDPNNVHLNDEQKQAVVKAAQANGAIIDEGHNGQQVDDSGNFEAKGSGLGKKILIGAAIGGLALTGLGLAGVGPLGGALGLGGAADAGVEAGATAGLDTSVASGALAGGAGTGLGVGADVAGTGAFDAAGNFIGDSTLVGGVDGVSSAVGTLGSAGSTASKIAALLKAGGAGIGAATSAAGANRNTQENAGLTANAQNITGQSAFENELMARAKEEATQRSTANKDVYRNSVTQNPRVSPFDPVGAPKYSDQYKATEANLGAQGAAKLATPAAYDTSKMPALAPYTPIAPNNVQGATGTAPTALEKIGNIASPAMSILGATAGGKSPTTAELIAQLFGG